MGLKWYADALVDDIVDRSVVFTSQADFAGESNRSVSKYLADLVLATFRYDFLIVDKSQMVVTQLV